MKKEKENQPIDNLFARKLGNLSLPPSADGFDRLRSRMGSTESTGKVVFWRNPAVQRYVAVAACVVLVCLLGWLYLPTDYKSGGSSLAVRQSKTSRKAPNEQTERVANKEAPQPQPINSSRQGASGEQVAQNSDLGHKDRKQQAASFTKQGTPTVAQTRPVESESKLNEPAAVASTASPTPRPTESTTKPLPSAERVLVVTIDEPAVLVAARREKTASDEKPMVALDDKAAKEATTGNLWQKIKQVKQGELIAKSDNPTNDEQGLLSRAYMGLKHSIEKNKATKQ